MDPQKKGSFGKGAFQKNPFSRDSRESEIPEILPKGPSRTKNTTDSKFTIRSKFATAIVKHYGGHFETTISKGKLSSKSLQK